MMYIGEIRKLRQEFIQAYRSEDLQLALTLGSRLLLMHSQNERGSQMEYAVDMSNMGLVQDELGNFQKAVEFYQKAAEIKKSCGGESLSYADTVNNLAIVYCSLKRYDEALLMQSKVLEVRDLKLGREHTDYVHTLYNMGSTYMMKKDYDNALEFHQKAVKRAQGCKSFDVLDFADIHSAIAKCYEKKGNYKKSISYYEMSVDLIKKAKGNHDFLRMTNCVLLARVCEKAGFVELAIEYYEKALELRKKIMDINHLDYVNGMNYLARLYRKNHQCDEAIRMHQETLHHVEKLLGKDHLFYADMIGEIALDYGEMGDYGQALFYGNMALEDKVLATTQEDPQMSSSLWVLGKTLIGIGEFDSGLSYLYQALSIRKNAFGSYDEFCGDYFYEIAVAYLKQGAYEAAFHAISQAIEIGQANKNIPLDAYLEELDLLIEIKKKQDDMVQATALLLKAAEAVKAEFGGEHPNYAAVLGKVGYAYYVAGDWSSALKALEQAILIQKEMLDEDNPYYMTTLSDLAGLCRSKGDFERAIALYREKNDMNFEETSGEQLEAAKTLLDIAICYALSKDAKRAEAYLGEAADRARRSGQQNDKEYVKRMRQYALAKDRKTMNEDALGMDYPMKRPKAAETDGVLKFLLEAFRKKEGQGTEERFESAFDALAIGEIYEGQGDGTEAIYWYSVAEKQGEGPCYISACKKLAEVFLKEGHTAKACQRATNGKEYLAEYHESDRENYCTMLRILGDCYVKADEKEYATRIYLIWQELYERLRLPKNKCYWGYIDGLARLCVDTKRHQDAAVFYEALTLNILQTEGETDAWAKNMMKGAQIYDLLGDSARTQKMLNAVTSYLRGQKKTTEMYDRMYDTIGRLYASAGNQEKALEILVQQYKNAFLDGRPLTKAATQILLRLLEEKGAESAYIAVKNGEILNGFC